MLLLALLALGLLAAQDAKICGDGWGLATQRGTIHLSLGLPVEFG